MGGSEGGKEGVTNEGRKYEVNEQANPKLNVFGFGTNPETLASV